MGRTSYTDEQRDEAVAMYREHGATHTATTLDIPRRTILDWAKKAGAVAQADQEKTAEARAVAAERVASTWGDFREDEALGAGSGAVQLRQRLLQAATSDYETDEDGRVYGGPEPALIRACATAYGILIDKAELLSGRATARIETWAESELDDEIRGLVAEMEGRIMADHDATVAAALAEEDTDE